MLVVRASPGPEKPFAAKHQPFRRYNTNCIALRCICNERQTGGSSAFAVEKQTPNLGRETYAENAQGMNLDIADGTAQYANHANQNRLESMTDSPSGGTRWSTQLFLLPRICQLMRI